MSRRLDLAQVEGFNNDEHRQQVQKELARRMPKKGYVVPASSVHLDGLTSERDIRRVLGLGAERPSHIPCSSASSLELEGLLENGVRSLER